MNGSAKPMSSSSQFRASKGNMTSKTEWARTNLMHSERWSTNFCGNKITTDETMKKKKAISKYWAIRRKPE